MTDDDKITKYTRAFDTMPSSGKLKRRWIDKNKKEERSREEDSVYNREITKLNANNRENYACKARHLQIALLLDHFERSTIHPFIVKTNKQTAEQNPGRINPFLRIN